VLFPVLNGSLIVAGKRSRPWAARRAAVGRIAATALAAALAAA
jgi:hypothetical protein